MVLLLGGVGWWGGNRPTPSIPVFQDTNSKPPLAAKAFRLEDENEVFSAYAGSASCRECHETAYDLWAGSNHGLAERLVQAGMDKAAFDPARSFAHGTQRSEVCWVDGQAQATSLGLSGKAETHTVERVIGRNPLRQFLVPFPGGRLQTLEASYDPITNQWFNVFGQEDRKPGEWGHWTGRGMNWNSMCASCHNTRVRKNYDEATDTYHTTMAERAVGCESCHGPMKSHLDWQKVHGKSGQPDPTVARLTRAQTLDNCGFCHARRVDLTGDFKPGDNFFDHQELVTVDYSDRYYPDGQVRDENFEHAAFLGSRMHFRGVNCLDCHNPHSGKTILPSTWLCQRCHAGNYENAPVIDPVKHSRHKVFGYSSDGQVTNLDLTTYQAKDIKETGGECIHCHMPQTVYMERHWRHDHGFTIPDPLLTKQFGIPNACNRCHQDKDTDWALKYVEEWYGDKMERPTRRRAQAIARARAGHPSARDELLPIFEKEELSYWKASLAGMLEPWAAEPKVMNALLNGLNDTNPLVRAAVVRALEPLANSGLPAVSSAIQSKLDDPVRNVRVAAAWAWRSKLSPSLLAASELQAYLDLNADQPTGQMQKGIFHYSRQELPEALQHIQKAVAWDPYSPPFRHELAVVLSTMNRLPEAVEQLKEACRLAPRDAEAHYKLGLAFHELGDMRGAIQELEKAVQLDHRHARAWYNLGLAQHATSDPARAVESLLRAESADPSDPQIPYARATILARLGQVAEAKEAVRRALELRPDYAEARQFLEIISR